ncbi:hypothetical protein JTE90_021487, partial [Oedothorax gibbosus]
ATSTEKIRHTKTSINI